MIQEEITARGPRYIIERWANGWLLCGTKTNGSAIPINALMETVSLFDKDSVMDNGISHHLRQTGKEEVVACVVTKSGSETWRKEIEKYISNFPPQERWWKGLDVGTSSAAIFSVFCDEKWKHEASKFGANSVPYDADDFGRCKVLLDLFPEWRERLSEVADAFPNTLWPKIISRWIEIENSEPEEQSRILCCMTKI